MTEAMTAGEGALVLSTRRVRPLDGHAPMLARIDSGRKGAECAYIHTSVFDLRARTSYPGGMERAELEEHLAHYIRMREVGKAVGYDVRDWDRKIADVKDQLRSLDSVSDHGTRQGATKSYPRNPGDADV